MLIGLYGGVCAGKHEAADYLVKYEGFELRGLPTEETKQEDPELYAVAQMEFLDSVTKDFQERIVTIIHECNEFVLDGLLRRPFFLLVSVDAPIMVRWGRYQKKYLGSEEKPSSLDQFLAESDKNIYHPSQGLFRLDGEAHVRLVNFSDLLPCLHVQLRSLNLNDKTRLRPSWDKYFMELALLAAQRSNCMKRRVGCVLVREMRVISTGYNGTPRGLLNCNEGGCSRCNGAAQGGQGLSTCLCIHAEENALLEAGRDRIREGSVLYCDTCPCLTCSVKIAQVGISEVVYNKSYSMDNDTAAVLKAGGVRLRQFSPPQMGLSGAVSLATC